jgi:hypothetical protein
VIHHAIVKNDLIIPEPNMSTLPDLRFQLSRRAALKAGVASLAAGVAPWEAFAQTTAAGTVEAVSGMATAAGSGVNRVLAAKTSIFIADVVKTGADAKLAMMLGQRTMIRLGSGAELTIERYLVDAGGEINLGAGSLQFERTGKPSGTDLKIKSPYGLIAVRGTRFYAGTFLGVWGVFVAQGAVDVTGGGKTVRVTKDLGTNVATPGGTPSDPKAWGWPRIEAAIRAVR